MKKDNITYCNMCGTIICRENEIPEKEGLHVEKHWGYFSEKDGEIHSFDLCEKCYDKLTEDFLFPPLKTEETVLI